MATNAVYRDPADLPAEIPVFPLPGALLLPRGQLPLNIFEPRYLAMVDDALLEGHRIIGMVQPLPGEEEAERPRLCEVGCAGRITQLGETGDGRYMLSLTGIARFRILGERDGDRPYRRCTVDFGAFRDDFEPRRGEEAVDRESLLKALAAFLKANALEADWDGIRRAPTEVLVNSLCMMSPWGVREKQALLEAPDLKTRAALLVAVTEVALSRNEADTPRKVLN